MGQIGRLGFHGTSGDKRKGGKDTGAGAGKPRGGEGERGSTAEPMIEDKFSGEPGEVKVTMKRRYKQETLIGSGRKAIVERHYTDHGHPEMHSNPHDHIISWYKRDRDGKPCPLYDDPTNYRDGDRIPELKEFLT